MTNTTSNSLYISPFSENSNNVITLKGHMANIVSYAPQLREDGILGIAGFTLAVKKLGEINTAFGIENNAIGNKGQGYDYFSIKVIFTEDVEYDSLERLERLKDATDLEVVGQLYMEKFESIMPNGETRNIYRPTIIAQTIKQI